MKLFQKLQSLLDLVRSASDLKHAHKNSLTEKLGYENNNLKKTKQAVKSKLLRKTFGETQQREGREVSAFRKNALQPIAFQEMLMGHLP